MQAGKYELELLAIRTLCAGKEAAGVLLNSTNLTHFHFPTTQLMYRRAVARLKGEGHLPSWNDLLNDSTVPEEKRQNAQRIVRKKRLKPLISKKKGDALFESLDRYRKLRAFYEVLNKGGNAIKQTTADIDAIIKQSKQDMIAIDVNHRGVPITVPGLKAAHVKESLTNVDARIETGLAEFDEKSGGIPQGAVFLMGAESGQYKSVMALQLAKNIAKGKRPLVFYSLEMPQAEITQRLTANELEVDIGAAINKWQWMRRKAANFKEQESIDARHFKWAEDMSVRYEAATKEWSEFFHTTCPADEVDINWVLQQAEMTDREIVVIDYIGLLGGLSGDDQWRAMSNVARQCKIWTNRTGKTVIILAQMSFTDGKIDLKYSRAIKDHVNNMWGWSTIEVNGRTYICNHQAKARGSRRFPFILRVWPEYNKIGDLVDLQDEEVALAALEDIKAEKDPAKRYLKAVDGNEAKGRKLIELDDNEPMLTNGGLGGSKGKRIHDVTAEAPWDNDGGQRVNIRRRKLAPRITATQIREAAATKTRVVALAKLQKGHGDLTIEEAAIQAGEVIRRWEEASAGQRIGIDKLARELLGLTTTKEILTQVRRLQGDKGALKRLTKQELETHKARIEVIKEATATMKAKGSEYVSEDDFYDKDDLILDVERGQEPIADPATLEQAWQTNAVLWADQAAITLPNSAKPNDKRWGANGDEEAVAIYKRTLKLRANRDSVKGKRMKLWPPKQGRVEDYHYLDDIQLDNVVHIARKVADQDISKMPLDDLASTIAQYVELVGPGVSRLHNHRRPRVELTDEAYAKACKKFGLEAA